MFSPASHLPPFVMASASRRRGGNLARAHGSRAGLFYSPLWASYRVPCGIRLSRDARSVTGAGTSVDTAKRAVRMRRRVRSRSSALLTRHLSTSFREAAQKLRAHDANRHQAAILPIVAGLAGAPGHVMRSAPVRPLPSPEVDYFAHCFVSVVRTLDPSNVAFTEGGKVFRRRRNGSHC